LIQPPMDRPFAVRGSLDCPARRASPDDRDPAWIRATPPTAGTAVRGRSSPCSCTPLAAVSAFQCLATARGRMCVSSTSGASRSIFCKRSMFSVESPVRLSLSSPARRAASSTGWTVRRGKAAGFCPRRNAANWSVMRRMSRLVLGKSTFSARNFPSIFRGRISEVTLTRVPLGCRRSSIPPWASRNGPFSKTRRTR